MTPELEKEIRAEFDPAKARNQVLEAANKLAANSNFYIQGFEAHKLGNLVQAIFEELNLQIEQAFLAGRASALGKLEQVGGLYQFGPRETCWWKYSPTYKPAEYFDTEPGQVVRSIQIFRLPPEIEKEMKK